jgi:hypothetical protein
MTIRDVINKRKRRGILITYGALGLVIADFIRAAISNTMPVVVFIGFPVFFGGLLYSMFWIICPSCKLTLGHMAMYSGGPFSISKKFRFCPFCGVDLDSEVKAG